MEEQVAMQMGAETSRGERGAAERGLLGGLDAEKLTLGGAASLLGIGFGLIWFWLPEVTYGLYFGAILAQGGGDLAESAGEGLWLKLGVSCVVALVIGLIGGRATRRYGWSAAPLLFLLAFACGTTLLVLRGLQGGLPGRNIEMLMYRYWDSGRVVTMVSVVYYGAIFCFAALGGAVSGRLRRRLRTSSLAAAGLAWIGVPVLWIVTRQWASQQLSGVAYGDWTLGALAGQAELLIPYLLGGIWLAMVVPGRMGWAGAVSVGLLPVLNVARGFLRIETFAGGSKLLPYLPELGIPLLSALAGAGLAALFAGGWSRGKAALALGVLAGLSLAILALSAAGG